ncbi:MAG: gamma-glutamyltransferase family protein [Chloroflexi bacterium]|nr:gamma-glutamyltransferase family protein [Chloroflexota bacterium]
MAEFTAENGIIAAGHRLEAEAGLQMLRSGGNAIDAAVAAAFAADLAEPAMCGLGGHGVMSIFMADTGKTTVVDFYDVAPSGATPDMYELAPRAGEGSLAALGYPAVEDDAQQLGHTSVMVPGQAAGLCAAHERFGSLPLDQVLAPAISLAEDGVPVDPSMARYIAEAADDIRRYPETANIFLNIAPGAPVVRTDLAKTLRLIARDGADAFYKGEVAEAIAANMEANGGILTLDDLAAYEPFIYEPEAYTYRGYEYVTGGNVTLSEALNILENFDLAATGAGGVRSTHLMIEAMRLAWADTLMHVGDPRGNNSPWTGLTSKEYARRRAREIDPTLAARTVSPDDPWNFEGRLRPSSRPWPVDSAHRMSGNTTKVITMDAEGNAVSLITSLGTPFASKVVVPGTGVLLNNSMHRLDPRPGYLNSVAPGKGMQRLTAAVMVFRDERPLAALAGSLSIFMGGMGIHPLVNLVDFEMGIQEAIEVYRFHPTGDAVWIDERVPPQVQRGLAEMGHDLLPRRQSFGDTHFGNHVGITVDADASRIYGAGDPFHANAVMGY